MSSDIKIKLPSTEELSHFEKELLDPTNSHDITEFTFLNISDNDTNTKCLPENLDDLFVIDTQPNRVSTNEKPLYAMDTTQSNLGDSEDQMDNDKTIKLSLSGFESKKELIEWARTIPTTLQVEEIPTIFDEKASPFSSVKRRKEPEVMTKSVMQPGFEQKFSIPAYTESKKALAKKRREEKASTKGSDWYDMKAPEMTEELEADLEVLQMRGALSSWTGYRKNDYKKGPKYFQLATVEDSPIDFYHSRVPKKDRKQTLVDELLADADFRKTNKNMYNKAVEKLGGKHIKRKKNPRKA